MFQSRSRHNEFETETKLRDELSLWVSRIGRRQMMTWCTQISEENLGSYTISGSEVEENFVHWNLSVVACLATVRKKLWTKQAVPSGSYNRFIDCCCTIVWQYAIHWYTRAQRKSRGRGCWLFVRERNSAARRVILIPYAR